MGYAASWLTEWVAYDAEARAVLGLKPDEKLAGLVHIGRPTVPAQDRPRPALEDIVSRWPG